MEESNQNQILHQNSGSSSEVTKDGSVGKHDFSAFMDKFQSAVDDDDELEAMADLGDNSNNQNLGSLDSYQNPSLQK